MSTPTLRFAPGGAGLHVDLEKLVPSRLLVQGSSGAGKSWLVRYLLEQTHGRIQQFVFDPEGELVTLREKFDYVVASASGDGDVRADPETADLLCRQLVELQASAIFDLNELDPEDRELFVANFLNRLVNMPREQWRSALVVVDEAHEFCPQHGQPPSRKPMELIVSKGRKRGLCAVYCTQRLSKLSKNASDLQSILVGYTGLDVDVQRAGDILGFDKTRREELSRLEHEFFAFGPALSREVIRVRSGPLQTHHPEPGELRAPTPPAGGELQELIAQLAAARAPEEDSNESPNEARSGPPAGWVSPAELERRVAAAVEAERERGAAEVARVVAAQREAARPHLDGLLHVLANGWMPPEAAAEAPPAERSPASQSKSVPPKPASAPRPRRAEQGSGDLGGPEVRILGALAWLEAIGVRPASNVAAAFLARYSPTSSSYKNARGNLRTLGLIEYPSEAMLALTDAGRPLAKPPEIPKSRVGLHRGVMERLPGPEQRILEPLLRTYPASIENVALAAAANYSPTSSSYKNARGFLRTLGLIRYPSEGQIAATELLFPKGLR